MKKGLALLLAGVMMLSMSGCGEKSADGETAPTKAPIKAQLEAVANESYKLIETDTLSAEATDVFGNHSITILGDSMGHGSQTGDIYENSWPNLLKKVINKKTGDNNHGFVTVEGTLWGKTVSHELHAFPETEQGFKNPGARGDAWTEYRTAELLGTKGLGSSVKDAELTFTVREKYTYFCVYYQTGPDYGEFEVRDSKGKALTNADGKTQISCENSEEIYARTAFYKMDDLQDDLKIVLHVNTDEEVIFTGFGYYNTLDGVVVNNYSNGGLQFAGTGKTSTGETTGLDERFLDLAATSGTVIFALGYNDAYFTTDMDLFAQRVDYLVDAVNKNGVKLIVSDCVWDKSATKKNFAKLYPRVAQVKEQLKRLAEETGGVYLDQQAIHGDALIDSCEDGVHPNADGHAMIAQSIVEALGLEETA